ncbi:hypothetical protein [Streptomyces hundungensis]|uniref:hypothetical protein n=1 Tax=Streptomyces hundungensis TaxID=1077946 RepID=UPI0033D493EF
MSNDYEPVFKRSKWGTNRYAYNAHNPVGLALIVISLALVVVMLVMMGNRVGPFAPPAHEPSSVPSTPDRHWSVPSTDKGPGVGTYSSVDHNPAHSASGGRVSGPRAVE